MKIISLRQCPDELERFVDFFSRHWGMRELYRNCITASLSTKSPLPQWYLLVEEDDRIVGGAGLVSNDFISRMDLWPWLCALFVEDEFRGHAYGALLIQYLKQESCRLGFLKLYLATDSTGYYEKYGRGPRRTRRNRKRGRTGGRTPNPSPEKRCGTVAVAEFDPCADR